MCGGVARATPQHCSRWSCPGPVVWYINTTQYTMRTSCCLLLWQYSGTRVQPGSCCLQPTSTCLPSPAASAPRRAFTAEADAAPAPALDLLLWGLLKSCWWPFCCCCSCCCCCCVTCCMRMAGRRLDHDCCWAAATAADAPATCLLEGAALLSLSTSECLPLLLQLCVAKPCAAWCCLLSSCCTSNSRTLCFFTG